MIIPIKIGNVHFPAVVDTAAQVTVVSREITDNLDLKLSSEVVKLTGAEQGSYFPAKIARNVLLKIGFKKIKWDPYVASLEEPVILGLDLLMDLKAVIDLGGNSVRSGGDVVCATAHINEIGVKYNVRRVTLRNRTVAPPHSVSYASVRLDGLTGGNFYLQGKMIDPCVEIPNMLINPTVGEVTIALHNEGSRNVKFKPGFDMGSAVEVTAVNSLKGEDVTEPPYVHSLMAPAALCKIDPVSQVSLPRGKGTSVASSAVDSLTHEGSHLEFQSVAPSAADVASQLSHVDLDSQVSVSSVDPGRLVSLPQGKGTSVAPSAADVASQLSHVDLDSQVSEINYSPISTGNLPHVITPESRSTISDSNSPIASNAEGVTNTRKAGLNTSALGASDGVKVGMKEGDSEVVPQHLEGLYRVFIDGLDNEQTSKLRVLLTRYADVFASNDTDLGCFPGIKHKIDTGNAKPIRQPMRRTRMGFEQEERKHLESMLRNGVIQPSMSRVSK